MLCTIVLLGVFSQSLNGMITSVAKSPDGRYISWGSGSLIIIWNIVDNTYYRTLVGHEDSISNITFSSDGKIIISRSCDNTIKTWDIVSGLCIKTIVVLHTNSSNEFKSPNIGLMKYVPGGTFQIGSDPKNTSKVSAFFMSEKEITREQFKRIMGYDPSATYNSTGQQDPVQRVNWYSALVFCNKLSMLEGLTPVYTIKDSTDWSSVPTVTANWDVNGYRLPTEMEWMWAAMGAVNGTTGYTKAFAGSNGTNDIGDYAWAGWNSGSTTHPVGTKQPNELGLYDMSGNVWEWCWDWWTKNYPSGSTTNYKGAASGDDRVKRGGSWRSGASDASVAYRFNDHPSTLRSSVGFRVVRP